MSAFRRGARRAGKHHRCRRFGVTSLYVTHNLEEALGMSDRIVVMRAGLFERSGMPGDIYDHPRTAFVGSAEPPPQDTANAWPVTVIRSVFLGDMTQIHVRWGTRELIARQTGPAPVADGATAHLAIDPATCILLDLPDRS